MNKYKKSFMKTKASHLRIMERSLYKNKRENALASTYRKRGTNLRNQETTKINAKNEIEELFDSLAHGSNQLDVADLISYMNSLGSQYRDSIMLKILRIYQVRLLLTEDGAHQVYHKIAVCEHYQRRY